MPRLSRKHLGLWPRLVAGLVCLVVVGCRIPAFDWASNGGSVQLAALPRTETIVIGGRDPQDGLGQAALAADTTVRGRVDLPETYKAQASSNTVVTNTGLQLRDDSGGTVVVDKTDAAGNFELHLNGYTPSSAAGVTYLLEATKSLGDGPGKDALRFRTFLRWDGANWLSITKSEIVISALTTALTLESSLDPGNIPSIATIDTVTIGSPLSGDRFKDGGHPDTEISGLATAILGFLAGDVDPVSAVTAIKPRIDSITPTAEVGQAVKIDGVGFSPLLSGNTIRFAADQVASIYLATPTSLLVAVPPGAVTGNVTIGTSLGTSLGVAFTVKPSAGAGSGVVISNIVPPAAGPGEIINIVGTGFSTAPAANVVTFPGGKLATPASASATVLTVVVPVGTKNGNLRVAVGSESRSNDFHFRITIPIIFAALPSPFRGGPGDQVTVNGTNFGVQGSQSTVRFGGVDGANAQAVDSWTEAQILARVPGPQTDNVVSGPIVVVNSAGAVSDTFGSYVATMSLVEEFDDTTNFDGANSSTVGWGGSVARVREDGDLTVAQGQTYTISTAIAPRSLISTSNSVGAISLAVQSTAGFSVGDEVLIIQLWGPNSGKYEFNRIAAINGNSISVQNGVANPYSGTNSLIQRVPHYGTVVVNGTLTTQGVKDIGNPGGFLVFRAINLTVGTTGRIKADGLGGMGGAGGNPALALSPGGLPTGGAARQPASNGGGAGGGVAITSGTLTAGGGGGYAAGGTATSPYNSSVTYGGGPGVGQGSNGGGGGAAEGSGNNVIGAGGGGAYGTGGQDGTQVLQNNSNRYMNGRGGGAGGASDLSTVHPGAGGGGAGVFNTSFPENGTGGNGGGAIMIFASNLVCNGKIMSDGDPGGSQGYGNAGGGSGGAVMLTAKTMNLVASAISAAGGVGSVLTYPNGPEGPGNAKGGNGGFGRVRLNYESLNGSGYPNSGAESSAIVSGTPKTSGGTIGSPLSAYIGVSQSLGYDTRCPAPTFTTAQVVTSQTLGGITGVLFSTSADKQSWSSFESNLASVPSRRYIRWKASHSGDAAIDRVRIEYQY